MPVSLVGQRVTGTPSGEFSTTRPGANDTSPGSVTDRITAPVLLGAGLWLLAGAVALTARWGEIDAQHPFAATTGLALLVIATAGGILLWWRARRADRRGRHSGVGRLTGELADERDAAEVLAVMDAWWRVAGAAALASDGPRVRRVRVEVLARLAHARLITSDVARRLGAETAPLRWRERRR